MTNIEQYISQEHQDYLKDYITCNIKDFISPGNAEMTFENIAKYSQEYFNDILLFEAMPFSIDSSIDTAIKRKYNPAKQIDEINKIKAIRLSIDDNYNGLDSNARKEIKQSLLAALYSGESEDEIKTNILTYIENKKTAQQSELKNKQAELENKQARDKLVNQNGRYVTRIDTVNLDPFISAEIKNIQNIADTEIDGKVSTITATSDFNNQARVKTEIHNIKQKAELKIAKLIDDAKQLQAEPNIPTSVKSKWYTFSSPDEKKAKATIEKIIEDQRRGVVKLKLAYNSATTDAERKSAIAEINKYNASIETKIKKIEDTLNLPKQNAKNVDSSEIKNPLKTTFFSSSSNKSAKQQIDSVVAKNNAKVENLKERLKLTVDPVEKINIEVQIADAKLMAKNEISTILANIQPRRIPFSKKGASIGALGVGAVGIGALAFSSSPASADELPGLIKKAKDIYEQIKDANADDSYKVGVFGVGPVGYDSTQEDYQQAFEALSKKITDSIGEVIPTLSTDNPMVAKYTEIRIQLKSLKIDGTSNIGKLNKAIESLEDQLNSFSELFAKSWGFGLLGLLTVLLGVGYIKTRDKIKMVFMDRKIKKHEGVFGDFEIPITYDYHKYSLDLNSCKMSSCDLNKSRASVIKVSEIDQSVNCYVNCYTENTSKYIVGSTVNLVTHLVNIGKDVSKLKHIKDLKHNSDLESKKIADSVCDMYEYYIETVIPVLISESTIRSHYISTLNKQIESAISDVVKSRSKTIANIVSHEQPMRQINRDNFKQLGNQQNKPNYGGNRDPKQLNRPPNQNRTFNHGRPPQTFSQ